MHAGKLIVIARYYLLDFVRCQFLWLFLEGIIEKNSINAQILQNEPHRPGYPYLFALVRLFFGYGDCFCIIQPNLP